MTEKKSLTKEDIQLFRETMGEVKPLKQREKKNIQDKKSSPTESYRRAQAVKEAENLPAKGHYKKIMPEETLFYMQPGVQQKYSKHLRQGKIPFEASLDLHGMTIDEAEKNVLNFLSVAHKEGKRCVLLIHGKGISKDNHSYTLKEMLNAQLPTLPYVLGFVSAPQNQGGAGAIYVLLKKITGV